MTMVENKYKIVAMVSLLILLPIILSSLATQYETCGIINHNCTSASGYVKPSEINQFLDEVVCENTKPYASEPVYRDLNTGKCYGYGVGSSPPPPNAKLVWIGSGKDKNTNSNFQGYKEFEVSGIEGWQDTGLYVDSGDTIEIKSSGTIQFDSGGRKASPDGEINPAGPYFAQANPYGICRFLICRERFPALTLVGRIGTADLKDYGNGFNAGSHFIMTADKPGNLLLGFNDEFVDADRSGLDSGGAGDNSGSFTSLITVQKNRK